MVRQIAVLVVLAIGFSLSTAAIRAQPPQDGTIMVMASENVRVQPTVLRLEVQIQAKGETAEKAVKSLQSRRKEALAKLKELKADEASIQMKNTVLVRNTIYSPYSTPIPGTPMPFYGTPTVIPPTGSPTPAPKLSPPSTYVPSTSYRIPPDSVPPPWPTTDSPATPSNAFPPFGPADPGTLQPIPSTEFDDRSISATTELRAEWRLTSSDPDAIALAGESLREKLIAAGVFGKPEANSPSSIITPSGAIPVYAELPTGGFRLRYIGTLEPAQRKAAIAAALAKAKDRGAELAAAAGCDLGKIWHVSRDISGESISVVGPVYMSYPRANESETVSTTPELPEFSIRMSVNYLIVRLK